jgi:hypothetical protein
MAIVPSWVVPGQLIQIKVENDIGIEDLSDLQAKFKKMIEAGEDRVNILIDLQAMSSPLGEALLKPLLQRDSLLRNSRIGHLLVLGADRTSELVINGLSLALHLEVTYFETIEDVFGFNQGLHPASD